MHNILQNTAAGFVIAVFGICSIAMNIRQMVKLKCSNKINNFSFASKIAVSQQQITDKTAASGENQQSAYAKIKTQISFAVTVKPISAFVFPTQIELFLFYLNPKFQASSLLLCLYSLVYVGPVKKQHCWFSHEVVQSTTIKK